MRSVKKPQFDFSLDTLKAPALALGVVLILAGLGSWLITGFDTPTRILLAVGILVIGVFIAIDPEDVWRRLRTPGALYSGNTLLIGAAVIGILGLINVVASNRHQRWDLTANKQYSLSDQTLKVLAELPQTVQITAFYQDDDSRKRDAQDLLTEYETRSNGKVSVEFVDPDREPSRAQQAGIKEYGTTVMAMGDRRQTVTGARESDFTTALLRLTDPTQKKIYFTIGHNERKIDGFERDSYGQLKTSLESDNYVVETLLLAGNPEVPSDAALVVIAQPRNPFADEEKQAIKTYLDGGGKLMILTQPTLPPNLQQVPLTELVAQWGVEIASTPVAEGNPQFVLQREPFVPIVARYPNHKITEGLGLSFFPTTTYVNVPSDTPRGATITPLLQTSDRSWAETDSGQLADLRQLRFDEGADPKGPLTIGVAIDASPAGGASPPDRDEEQPERKTRVVIFGDADFAANETQQLASSNRDLFLNTANWLAEEEQLIAIRPKERDTRNVFLSAAQSNLVLFSSTLFLPAIVLAVGGFVWWSRR
jgi:ABC-type uncharacterized transport system involved in gliding motility auxiliary subunit